jgi:hypothetical protein
VLVLTDGTQVEAVAARVPAGWEALRLQVDRRGAQVVLPV